MGEIRTFNESHIPEVAALELKIFHGQRRPAGPALEKYFAEIFLRNPWRDEELPSLVYLHAGKVAGFLGVVPRPMAFRGRRIRAAVGSQLMVDPEQRCGVAGLEMVRRFFAGPQDLAFTDGATEAACAVWTAAGARVSQLHGIQWMRTLRPFGYARGSLASHPRLPSVMRAAARWSAPACALADAAVSKLPVRGLAAPRTAFRSFPADANEFLECAREIGWREPLRPCYDPDSFRWLTAQASAARAHGPLHMAVVHDPEGARAGCYACYFKPGGMAKALQLSARRRHFEQVLLALLRDAWSSGATAANGQIAPGFLLSYANQRCSLRYPGNGVLVHSRDSELLGTILQGDAALTRLDGEWWMRFAVEDWK